MVIWSIPAKHDLKKIHDYIAEDSKYYALKVSKASMFPALAEPWFLTFNANVDCQVVMTPEDFQEAGMEKIIEKWG